MNQSIFKKLDSRLHRVLLTVFLSTFLISGSLEYYLYRENTAFSLKALKASIQQRLEAIGKGAALLMDEKIHAEIFDHYDYKTPGFQELKNRLLSVAKTHNLTEEIYTLRLEDKSQFKASFVVMTGIQQKTGEPYISTPYTVPQEMLRVFEEGLSLTTDIYQSKSDEGGRWMSAFVPFREAGSKYFCVLEVDISVERLLLELEERRKTVAGFHVLRVIVISTLFLILWFVISTALKGSMQKLVSQPLDLLMHFIGLVKGGRYVADLNLQTRDEWEDLGSSFNAMVAEVGTSREELQQLNLSLEQRVIERTKSIQNLLDNAGQGFLSFNMDLIVQPEFSQECISIFGLPEIGGLKFVDLVQADPQAARELSDWLPNMFQDTMDFSMVCELSIREFSKGERSFSVEYKQILRGTEPQIMVVITEVTERLALEARIRKEQSFARMILRVLQYRNQFGDFCTQIRRCEATLKKCVDGEAVDLSLMFREVHTLKGMAGSFDFEELTSILHSLEEGLQKARKDATEVDRNFVLEHTTDLNIAWEGLQNLLQENLGDALDFQEQRIRIPKSLFQRILPSLSDTNLIQELKYFQMASLKDLLSPYELLVEELAEKQNKMIYPIRLNGCDLPVDPDHLGDLISSLVHMFRNMVDHGIESPEEREEIGKDPTGTLTVDCKVENETLILRFEDDGKGIDSETIARALVKKGLKTEADLESMSAAEILDCIFLPGFSSAENVTTTSGRGVGTDAIRASAQALSGSVRVESESGMGSVFEISIPWKK